MNYYIRKYWNSKWHQYDEDTPARISADAITNCLKTQNNTLSLWQISDIDKIDDEGGLALIGTLQSIATIDTIIFTEEEFKSLGFELKNSEGKTAVLGLKNTHSDIINLDIFSLTEFSKYLYKKLHDEEEKRKQIKEKIAEAKQRSEDYTSHEAELKKLFIRRYTASNIKDILTDAIERDKIQIGDLDESIREKLDLSTS